MADQTVSPRTKLYILIVLALLSTLYSILVRYTRVATSEKYITTTTVAMQEIIKFFLALSVLIWINKSFSKTWTMIRDEALYKPQETLKMAVPSFAYALQNNMNYIASSNLDVPVQQVLYQLKIPATAFCSVLLLGRSLSAQQWTAVFMVFAGLAMVSKPDDSPATATAEDQIVWIGVAAVLVAVFCSAFAGVYFEKMVKGTETSLWVQNLQMYVWTTLAGFLGVFMNDFAEVRERGFFYAYTPAVWLVLAVGGINGLVVSLVLKYADNIVKGFAAAASIVLSTIISYFLFGYIIGFGFLVGGLTVCSAICLYGIPLPCINKKYTTASKNIPQGSYSKLQNVVVHQTEDDEILAK